MTDWLSQHWVDAVPAWLGVLVAAFFGWLSWRFARTARASEVKAAQYAEDAAAAADRIATAQEAQTALLQSAADAEERSPWDLDRRGQMDYRLVNRTNTPKYEVVVTGEPTGQPPGVFRPGGGGDNSFDMVDRRQTVELELFVFAQTQERSVTVHWRPTQDHTGEPWTQRIGLP